LISGFRFVGFDLVTGDETKRRERVEERQTKGLEAPSGPKNRIQTDRNRGKM